MNLPAPSPDAHRRHDIDALRALAFVFVILYHVAMYYVADWSWHLKSPHEAEWLQWPMRVLNLWRMDLVFLVSGVSLGFLARRQGTGALLRSRGARLMLPLVFGMIVIVPYQAYAEGVARGLVAPGFGNFLLRYLSMTQPWPQGAFAGAEFGITWNHLWYLPYLFAYTALVALTLPLWRSAAGQWARRRFNALRGWKLLVLPVIPLLVWTVLLAPHFPPTHNLVRDFYLHAIYFTVFLYGFWMGVDTGVWKELERLRCVSLALAAAAVGTFIALRVGAWVAANGPHMDVLRTLYMWLAIATILGHGHRHLNRPFAWLRWANASVYPWYVLHQTLIVVAIAWIAPLALGPIAEPALILAATLGGCWLATDALVRRTGWLRPLFGLPRRPAAGPGPREAQSPLSLASTRNT